MTEFVALFVSCIVSAVDDRRSVVVGRQPRLNTDALLKSRKPVISKVSHRFQRCVLEVDDDGNCYGTSWVLSVLLWAVQSPSRVQGFLAELEDATRGSGAFVDHDAAIKVRSGSSWAKGTIAEGRFEPLLFQQRIVYGEKCYRIFLIIYGFIWCAQQRAYFMEIFEGRQP